MEKNEEYKILADIFKALSHINRIKIIDFLCEGEKCVCEIRNFINMDISTVSKHLSVLKKAGLIKDRKQRNQVYYQLLVPCLLNSSNCILKFVENSIINK